MGYTLPTVVVDPGKIPEETAGKPADGEQVFREDLRRNPRNPRSLFGLMNTLRAQQRDADAAWVEREFKDAWKEADTNLEISAL